MGMRKEVSEAAAQAFATDNEGTGRAGARDVVAADARARRHTQHNDFCVPRADTRLAAAAVHVLPASRRILMNPP